MVVVDCCFELAPERIPIHDCAVEDWQVDFWQLNCLCLVCGGSSSHKGWIACLLHGGEASQPSVDSVHFMSKRMLVID